MGSIETVRRNSGPITQEAKMSTERNTSLQRKEFLTTAPHCGITRLEHSRSKTRAQRWDYKTKGDAGLPKKDQQDNAEELVHR